MPDTGNSSGADKFYMFIVYTFYARSDPSLIFESRWYDSVCKILTVHNAWALTAGKLFITEEQRMERRTGGCTWDWLLPTTGYLCTPDQTEQMKQSMAWLRLSWHLKGTKVRGQGKNRTGGHLFCFLFQFVLFPGFFFWVLFCATFSVCPRKSESNPAVLRPSRPPPISLGKLAELRSCQHNTLNVTFTFTRLDTSD